MITLTLALLAATPSLTAAISDFDQGDYPKAAAALSRLLYPESSLSEPAERAQAHLFLAASHLALDDDRAAEREVKAMLRIDRNHPIDPRLDPRLAEMAARIRASMSPPPPPATVEKPPVEKNQQSARQVDLQLRPEPSFRWTRLVPFGVGQIIDDRVAVGIGFGAAQVALLAANLALGSQVKGCEPSTGTNCSGLQTWQNVTFFTFFGVAAWGIVDAIVLAPDPEPSP